jgi:hypothetical protein
MKVNLHELPAWWVRAIIIEYLDCRAFAGASEIWEFRFDEVTAEAVKRALEHERVVIHDTVFHNVHRDSFSQRLLQTIFSNIPVPISLSPDDAVPEGPVSPYHFPFGNAINEWDPKLEFSSHFQVFDEGQLWQWNIADFVPVDGQNYGKWVSSEIDLESLDEVRVRLAELRNPPVSPGENGHAAFVQRVQAFYSRLEDLRAPIRRKLWDIHVDKRAAFKGIGKVVKYEPPKMSMFEEFTVMDGEIHTRFHAEPVFYRALVRHARAATDLIGDPKLRPRLHDVYDERVQAVIAASACLEAFINTVCSSKVPKWALYEPKLDLRAKWHLCLAVHGKDAVFVAEREPYQSFGMVAALRNDWLHYKRPLRQVCVSGGKSTTWIETKMSTRFVEKLPNNVLLIIKELCDAISYPVPAWLEPGPGWEL